MKTRISLYNLLILFYNFLKAKDNADIGYQEVNKTEKEFMEEINKRVTFDRKVLQSLLYYSNMRSEDGKFWHPDKKRFSKMINSILHGSNLKFDYKYNLIEKREDEEWN